MICQIRIQPLQRTSRTPLIVAVRVLIAAAMLSAKRNRGQWTARNRLEAQERTADRGDRNVMKSTW